MKTFQEVIHTLETYWTKQGCILQQSYDLESGAGTFHPETFLRVAGPEPYNVCHAAVSKRPSDGRYAQNPNRLQRFHQFQVLMKPCPPNLQALYLGSLEALGFNLKKHDIRFVHDDWESPSQGAWGLGWEVWCDGMEVTQFTYFQSVGGIALTVIPGELAYGIERIAMFLQDKSSVYDVKYNETLTYGDVFKQTEIESCYYNFEYANRDLLLHEFTSYEHEARKFIKLRLPTVAYDFAIRASHTFNLLEARRALSTTARTDMLHRVRALSCESLALYTEIREKLGFPLLPKATTTPSTAVIPSEKAVSAALEPFLLEIGTEEIPAECFPGAIDDFKHKLETFFIEEGIGFSYIEAYSTPRRLALMVHELQTATQTESIEKKGPKRAILFDATGSLTKQGEGFFHKMGLRPEKASFNDEGHLVYHETIHGKIAARVLQEKLPTLIASIHFPKKMVWEENAPPFVRPIRWIVALLGSHVVRFAYGSVVSSNITCGHKQTFPKPVPIPHPKKYISLLRRKGVIACPKERRRFLEKQLALQLKKYGAVIPRQSALVEEVLYLSECPHIDTLTFDPKYLILPRELLISEMARHQRYFPLLKNESLLTKTLVAIDKKPSALIVKNNEAVLRARLEDGYFLYLDDQKEPMDTFVEKLKHITFHPKLGTYADKIERMRLLLIEIARQIGIDLPLETLHLSKADLASQTVKEFPELQGIIGRELAFHLGKSSATATAIYEHWLPVEENGPLPETKEGAALALSDKLDNLISYVKIGIVPSSSKDPYALRRAALGIIRIVVRHRIAIDFSLLIPDEIRAVLTPFIHGRLESFLLDLGMTKEEIEYALLPDSLAIYNQVRIAHAIRELRANSSHFDELMEITKRVRGILKRHTHHPSLDAASLTQPAERSLYDTLLSIRNASAALVESNNYVELLQLLCTLKEPLAHFFDTIRVETDDLRERENRLGLLAEISALIGASIHLPR